MGNEGSVTRSASLFVWEMLKIVALALLIIVPIRYFLVQPFFVQGASMEPTFDGGEYLVIDQLSFRLRDPVRGEVVIFRYPNNPSQFFIKRIVGVPGDEVEVRDGRVKIQNDEYRQGVFLDESYLPPNTRTSGSQRVTLGEGEYYVLGDNRAASSDSRSWGALSRDLIIGRAWIRAWPLTEIDVFGVDRIGFLGV